MRIEKLRQWVKVLNPVKARALHPRAAVHPICGAAAAATTGTLFKVLSVIHGKKATSLWRFYGRPPVPGARSPVQGLCLAHEPGDSGAADDANGADEGGLLYESPACSHAHTCTARGMHTGAALLLARTL